jgi:MFS family permease
LAFVTALAGIGNALVQPALSAFYLDITDAAHRSRVMGVKGSIAALGEIAGPLAVVLGSPWFGPQEVFLSAAVLVGLAALFALTVLRAPQHSVVVRYNA